MNKLDNKFLSIIETSGNCLNYSKDDRGHIGVFEDFGNENSIEFSVYSHEGMGMILAQLGYVSILNAKSYHIIMLPEQITLEQINVFEENKDYFVNQNHPIRTIIYCENKTDYGERYRKLHKEALIKGSRRTDYEQLYEEIENQKTFLKQKNSI